MPEIENKLYAYIGEIIKTNNSQPIRINGIENHIHILATMSKNIALSKFIEEIKRNSSRWIKTQGKQYENFAWQAGYGGFSVSQSILDSVKKYIEDQKEYHKKMTFKEEYIKLLQLHEVDYNDEYLWTP